MKSKLERYLKMFASINFLFLTSLGFLSWIILCYFKEVENHYIKHQAHFLEEFADTNTNETLTTAQIPCTDNTDIYINFLCIFICIYILAKITIVTERYVAKKLNEKYRLPNLDEVDLNFMNNASIDSLREQQESLMMKLDTLERQNTELKEMIKETNSNQQATNKNPNKRLNSKDAVSGRLQNFYISNRHFHLNRQVCVKNSERVTENLSNSEDEMHHLNQVWRKYLELQLLSIQSHSQNQILPGNYKLDVYMPVVLPQQEINQCNGLL